MNIHVDTLEYANTLEQAGIQRAHAEAIAKLQARSVTDLIEQELATKDDLKTELALSETKMRDEIRKTEASLREEIRERFNAVQVEIRSLKYAATIAAFAVSCVVVLSRLVR